MNADVNRSNQIDEYSYSISGYQNQIESQEREKAAIRDRIDRLCSVRDSVAEYKTTIQGDWSRESVNGLNWRMPDDWRGDTQNRFITDYTDGLLKDYQAYFDQIDSVHDALNSEIKRLQNSLYEMDGALGWLQARLNDCLNELNNLMN